MVPPGPHPGDENVDLASGGLPDLLSRGPTVDLRIGRVIKLIGHERAIAVVGDQLVGPLDGSTHALGARESG